MKQIEIKIAWSFRISTEFETFRNIFETCTMTRTVTPWPACRCILSHLFQAGRKYARDGKSWPKNPNRSFWFILDIGWHRTSHAGRHRDGGIFNIKFSSWRELNQKNNSRRGVCHQYATVTQSHHHRRRTLSISTTWEPASGTAIPPQPREVTRLRSQHISLWIQNTEDYRTYHRIHRLHGIDRAHVQAWQATKIWKKWNCIHFHSDVYVFT